MTAITRRRALSVVSTLLGVALLTSTVACGDDDDAAADTKRHLVKSEVERRPAASDAPVEETVAGIRDFAVRLAATQPDGNLVVSPTSIAVAFAMAEAGADDATAAKIAEVFGFPAQPGVHEAMNALTQALDDANIDADEPADQVTVELANAVWGQSGHEFNQPFLDILASDYGTGVETADFADDPSGSREAINAWVADITRDRIPELVPDGMITPQTVVMLVNAIYLKAGWDTPFTEDLTSDQPFHLADGSSVDVPMMNDSSLHTSASTGAGYSAVELPYKGGDLSMTVIVPDEGTSLADFEAGLTGERLAEIVNGLQPVTVDLSLPRWDTKSALDLAEPLSSLGLPIPGGDLSGIAPGAGIGAAVHAANITVDETGTEAAAATAVAGVTSAAPGQTITVKVDRPFLFLIQHRTTGTPLFYGRVADPRG
ncbi:MAG TPA: serpin family protein [Acidimicrobiales bacterium]|jgi:serpin B